MNRFHIYDDRMDQDAQWRKQVTSLMEAARDNGEFEMYLQPKVSLKTGQIVGAEALARWNNPNYGVVYPERFVSILEQNGFIQQLDFSMLQQACQFLQENKKSNQPMLPISLNLSKMHIGTDRLVERIFEIVNGCEIDTRLIEIEFKENVLSENTKKLVEVISHLKLLGFRVAIDNFGSVYSSINYLKDIPVDIVKIDREFFHSSVATGKGKIVLSKMVELIKSLRIVSVMEGVETEEQVQFLKRYGCDVGQGFYFARPMTQANFREYINHRNVLEKVDNYSASTSGTLRTESYSNVIPQEFHMDNWELYALGKNIDMGLMKGYLDGEATVQYVNDRALEYLGYTRQEFREVFHNNIVAFTHPDDAHIVKKNVEKLITAGTPLEFRTRAIRKDGKVIVLQGRSSCVIDIQGRPVGLYAFQDVTEKVEQTATLKKSLETKIQELEEMVASQQKSRDALRLSEERYRIVEDQSDDIMFEWDFDTDVLEFSNKYRKVFGREPHGTKGVTTNRDIRRHIHPEDRKTFENWVLNTYKKSERSESCFRVADVRGNYLWMSCRSTALCDSQGMPVKAIGVFTNVQAQKQLVEDLKQRAQLDPLTGLLNKAECQQQIDAYLKTLPQTSGALFMIDVDNFKAINDNLGHQLGDNILQEISQKIKQVFPNTELIGRIGGDEFVVFLPEVGEQKAYEKAECLTKILRLSYFGSVTKYEISGSIGLAWYPKHGNSFDTLYRLADIALYQAKNCGKNQFVIYDESIASHLLDNRTPVEYSSNFLNTYFQNDITFQVFSMLYETRDVAATVRMILELLGKRFSVDRVYTFQEVKDGEYLKNTYEWCAEGVSPEIQNLQRLPIKSLKPYFAQYSPEGVFCCEDIHKSVPEVYEICAPQGIKSLLHCAIYNEGEKIGFIGFDFCRDYHSWTGEEIAILGYISRILSVFMVKNVISDQLKTSHQNYASMVENLNGFVYVIDSETFEVLFVNRAMQTLGLDAGKVCYDMAFGAKEQCASCPIRKMSATNNYATSEVYSEILKGWVNSAASRIKWEGNREAILVCCTNISNYKG